MSSTAKQQKDLASTLRWDVWIPLQHWLTEQFVKEQFQLKFVSTEQLDDTLCGIHKCIDWMNVDHRISRPCQLFTKLKYSVLIWSKFCIFFLQASNRSKREKKSWNKSFISRYQLVWTLNQIITFFTKLEFANKNYFTDIIQKPTRTSFHIHNTSNFHFQISILKFYH